jgi:hypothetical protein
LPSDGGIVELEVVELEVVELEVVELEVVELEVVVFVAVGLAIRAQTFFLETNRQVTGTLTFFTWTVDFAPSF